jgi:hypothetical protein
MRRDNGVKMDLRETGFQHVKWMEVAQDFVKWWTLEIKVLNLRLLQP